MIFQLLLLDSGVTIPFHKENELYLKKITIQTHVVILRVNKFYNFSLKKKTKNHHDIYKSLHCIYRLLKLFFILRLLRSLEALLRLRFFFRKKIMCALASIILFEN